MNIFLIVVFALISLFGMIIGFVLFHHFKKFSLPGDFSSMKILKNFKIGSIALITISFILLIILIS